MINGEGPTSIHPSLLVTDAEEMARPRVCGHKKCTLTVIKKLKTLEINNHVKYTCLSLNKTK